MPHHSQRDDGYPGRDSPMGPGIFAFYFSRSDTRLKSSGINITDYLAFLELPGGCRVRPGWAAGACIQEGSFFRSGGQSELGLGSRARAGIWVS
jgi:hypothetical protein